MGRALVQFSTGAGSALVAYRAIEEYGLENTILITADTKVEHPDNWRFAAKVWLDLGRPTWHRLADGRTPMGVGMDLRVVPNNRMAVCSRVLKRELIRKFMDQHFDSENDVVLLGFDWTEEHRFIKSVEPWKPWTIDAPLMRPPYLEKPAILDWLRARGIEPPELYRHGFSHANCGGACVRGGQAQWALLYQTYPDTYLEWERDEEEIRTKLQKNVAILRDRTRGESKPLTLQRFRRERLPGGDFDRDDWGTCGCFMENDDG